MEQKWLILLLAVITHLNLMLAFWPGYWDPVRRLGRRFSTLVGPLLVPVVFGAMLLVGLVDHWEALPAWARIVGGLGAGAASATLVLNVAMLRALES